MMDDGRRKDLVSPDSSELPCSANSGKDCVEKEKRPASKTEKPSQLRNGLVRIYNVAVLFFK